MNIKQIVAWASIIIGIVLVAFAVHSINTFDKHYEFSDRVHNFFHHNPHWNPIIKFFGGTPQEKLPEHDTPALIIEGVGVVLIIAGGLMAYLFRRRKSS